MCGLGAIASPITSKTGRAALLGGLAGTLLAKKGDKKPKPQGGDALASGYSGQTFG